MTTARIWHLAQVTLATGLLAVAATTTPAMTLEAQDNRVFATGDVGNDLPRFQELLARPGVDTVVFVNSPGGDLWTALRVGRLIADRGLKTVVAGHCVSACSVMFMGGRERRFSDALPARATSVAIHGAHEQTTGTIIPAVQTEIYAFFKQRMGILFNDRVMNQALYEMDDIGALLTVHDPVRGTAMPPEHCRSSQTPRERCTRYPGESATTLGIATHAELVPLDLPATMQPRLRLLQRELPPREAGLDAMLAGLAQRLCRTQACRDELQAFPRRAPHRAFALGVGADVGGESRNVDEPDLALLVAIYRCNHREAPRAHLCEGQLLDDRPLAGLYQSADAVHRQALAALQPPRERFYANEEFGGGFGSATALRTERLADMTPARIDGVRTIATQELARWLSGSDRPVLIDAQGAYETIPGAQALVNGGRAYPQADRDDALSQRLLGLLGRLAPDKSAPVVVFGFGRAHWQAVNLALRARQAGYTQVVWYRGGLEAWKAASLPTAPMLLRAVAD